MKAESKEELKNLLMRVKKSKKKKSLKLNVFKSYFLGSKTTADGECKHKLGRQLLLDRKDLINLDSVLLS